VVGGILITAIFCFIIWLVFFRFKWLQWSIGWAVFSSLFLVHLLLIFLIGIRFVAPYSTKSVVVQHTIQLIPRLPEPTLVTEVLVEANTQVRKGQPLFEFDRRPYEYQVRQAEAALAQAKQNVLVLKSDEQVALDKVARAESELEYSRYQKQLSERLAKTGAGPEEDVHKWTAEMAVDEATAKEGESEAERARLRYESQIDGVNTAVAEAEAKLALARFYLDNTTLVAPEDGRIVNLQVRPGMVAGIIRVGAIASLICDADRYVLANYNQEELKYVEPGQPAELAFNLHPGQIFRGKVQAIWRANRAGQFLPSGDLPRFWQLPLETPQGQFAVQIDIEEPDPSLFPIGAGGYAAIYTGGGGFAALRRIVIRADSWLNFLYPLPF
jgi:multidrug resistance efflux pump